MRHCRRRGNINLDGVASSKRPLFWVVAVIAAACSALHERAAFTIALGRFARTLLQLCFCSFGINYIILILYDFM